MQSLVHPQYIFLQNPKLENFVLENGHSVDLAIVLCNFDGEVIMRIIPDTYVNGLLDHMKLSLGSHSPHHPTLST